MNVKEKIKSIIKQIKYEIFINFMGVLAASILSPYKDIRVEFFIGYVAGLMILGRKYIDAQK